ncbi:RDD family protein [Spirochaetia bacterium]|nr:RDD family protein [Spirochaetia bacterium]
MKMPGYAYTDSSLGVETPEGIEFVLFPAGPLIRSCAWGIDKLIQWVLMLIISTIAGILGQQSGGLWFFLILVFCIDWFYHVIWEILYRGQSPGKRIMGIRVVGSGGEPVSPGASFLRNLLRFADTFLFLYPIVLVCMSASRGFRRLGDWAGDTLVVYTNQSLAAPRFHPVPAQRISLPDIPALPPAGTLSFKEKQAILMFARRFSLLGKARADEIASGYVTQLRKITGDTGVSPSACLLGLAQILENGP